MLLLLIQPMLMFQRSDAASFGLPFGEKCADEAKRNNVKTKLKKRKMVEHMV